MERIKKIILMFMSLFLSGSHGKIEPLITDITVQYALSFLGTPYKWGGQTPVGLDCSGLVINVLKAEGKLPNKFDTTSQGLYNHFLEKLAPVNQPKKGCLVFYGESKHKISHVAICLNEWQIIEAAGGNSTTKTLEDAIKMDAFVRIRPYDYRSDIVAILH